MKKNHLTILAMLLSVSLLCVLLTACGSEPAPAEAPATVDEVATADQAVATPSESTPTEAPLPTEPPVTAPDSMAETLAFVGESAEALADRGCSQLVAVISEGSSAVIHFYQLDGYEWYERTELTASGNVGYNGVTADMHEGGQASPFGLFPVGQAFYIDDAPETGLEAFQITYDTYWVDDPSSVYYNRRVVGTENQDWSSAEQMYYITPQYQYGFVIDYNVDPVVSGAGSAIFFHVGSGNPTLGCVSTSQETVLQYLAALSAEQNPYIVIV